MAEVHGGHGDTAAEDSAACSAQHRHEQLQQQQEEEEEEAPRPFPACPPPPPPTTVSHSWEALLLVGSAVAEEARAAVRQETGFRTSAGVAANKMLAKLVSGIHKPDDQVRVCEGKRGVGCGVVCVGLNLWADMEHSRNVHAARLQVSHEGRLAITTASSHAIQRKCIRAPSPFPRNSPAYPHTAPPPPPPRPLQTILPPPEAAAFVAALPVRALPGVGHKLERELAAMGVVCVEELRRYEPAELAARFGNRAARFLYGACRGKVRARTRCAGAKCVRVRDVQGQSACAYTMCS